MIRESFRCNQTPLGSLDIVVVARTAADVASSETLRASLLNFWSAISKPCRLSS
jgi:ribonuclease P protein component